MEGAMIMLFLGGAYVDPPPRRVEEEERKLDPPDLEGAERKLDPPDLEPDGEILSTNVCLFNNQT